MLPLYDENQCKIRPRVNEMLIALNLIAFVFEVVYAHSHTGNGVMAQFALVPSRFVHHFDLSQLGTLISYMFMHQGLAHLLGNLWVLYIFGDNVEDRLGHFNYFVFYLVCGITAGATHILSDQASSISCIGASGAIAGVTGAYLMLYPSARVRMWIFLLWRPFWPAWVVIGGWFMLNCLSSITSPGDDVAYCAHIGGFYAGVILLYLYRKKDKEVFEADKFFAQTMRAPALWQLIFALIYVLSLGAAVYFHASGRAVEASPAPAVKNSAAKVSAPKTGKSSSSARSGRHTRQHHMQRHAKAR